MPQTSSLKLSKPLVFFDLETTGTRVETDRIVSLAFIKYTPDGQRCESGDILVNPECSIPAGASKIHGITDDMVCDQPTFQEQAEKLWESFQDCDLAGFNIVKFDIPLLKAEFQRAGKSGFGEGCQIVDVMKIYHKNETRTLSDAVQFYLQKDHLGAHGAHDDTKATCEILEEQIKKYGLPNDVHSLHDYCNDKDPSYVDSEGKFRWKDGEVVFGFGKLKSLKLSDTVERDRGYIEWMLGKDFSLEVKNILQQALEGELPQK